MSGACLDDRTLSFVDNAELYMPRKPGSLSTEPSELEFVRAFQRLVGEVFRLNGQLLVTADQLSKDLQISTARWQVIATIRNEWATVAEISRRLGLKRQSVQETVNRLKDQGLVEFESNPSHARASLIRLTPMGQNVMETLRERQIKLTEQFTRELGLSVKEIEALTSQLRRMREQAELTNALDFIEVKKKLRSTKGK